ncbi:MAG: S8 family serine peptidase, partial [Bacteroidota bacterium]
MDPALQELILLGNQEQKVEAIIRLQKADQLPEGIEVVCRFGDIVTCRLPHQKIETIWSDEAVASMKVARYVGIDPMPEQLTEVFDHQSQDTSSISSRAEITPNGGKGVVVGIIDWRFDFTHPNFLDEEGNTRFLAIWDQTEELEDDSLKYGYGKVHHQAAINEALLEDAPFQYLGYHPAKGDPLNDGAHGTHVLDIATGNGTIGDSSAAPYADIVAVHLSAGNIEEISSLGDSVRILEAIDFIREIAGDRPTVINTSVGKTAGPHNGKTLVEQGMDNFLTEQTGRCIVQSTGNYFKHRTHASGHLREGEEKSLTW